MNILIGSQWHDVTPMTRTPLCFSWGHGKNATDYAATEAFCDALGIDGRQYGTSDVARTWWNGESPFFVEVRDGTIDSYAQFAKWAGARPEFMGAGYAMELGTGWNQVNADRMRRIQRDDAPGSLVCDAPLAWNASNMSRMSNADVCFSWANISGMGFPEDAAWGAAMMSHYFPIGNWGFSPQLVHGSLNQYLADAGDLAMAIRLLAQYGCDYLPLWGTHYAAKMVRPDMWDETVNKDIAYWNARQRGLVDEGHVVMDVRFGPVGTLPGQTPDYWQQCQCRVAVRAGYLPVFASDTDLVLDVLTNPTGKTADPLAVKLWQSMQAYRGKALTKAAMIAVERGVADELRKRKGQ
jgi:hypothetical protein